MRQRIGHAGLGGGNAERRTKANQGRPEPKGSDKAMPKRAGEKR
jgi:hypothetical protein